MIHSMRIRAAGRVALVATTAALALSAHAARAADATAVSEIVVTGGLEATIPTQLAQFGNRLDVVTSHQIEAGNFVDIGMVLSNVRAGALPRAARAVPFPTTPPRCRAPGPARSST